MRLEMFGGNSHQYSSTSWPNHVKIGDLGRIEDKIPYLCEANHQSGNQTSCIVDQQNDSLWANGLHPNITNETVATRFQSLEEINEWRSVSDLYGLENQQATPSLMVGEAGELSPLYQRLIRSEVASWQRSFTVHHRGQSTNGDSNDEAYKYTDESYETQPGMSRVILLPLKTDDRCH